MIPLYFDYTKLTLGEIDTYKHTTFECDGDKKQIKVSIKEVNKNDTNE